MRKGVALGCDLTSIDEAVPTLGAYYEKNPPRWKGGAKARRYIKWTFYGVLTVERQGPGEWTVERSGAILVRSDDDAIFATSEEAKRVADIHIQDGFPNAEPVDDGFSWYDYRACVAGPAPTIETKVSVF